VVEKMSNKPSKLKRPTFVKRDYVLHKSPDEDRWTMMPMHPPEEAQPLSSFTTAELIGIATKQIDLSKLKAKEPWEERDLSTAPYSSLGFLFKEGRMLTTSPGFINIPVPGGNLRIEFVEDAPERGSLENLDDHTIVVEAPISPVASLNISYPMLFSGAKVATVTVLALQKALHDTAQTIELRWDMYAYLPDVTTAEEARDRLRVILRGKVPAELGELESGPADLSQRTDPLLDENNGEETADRQPEGAARVDRRQEEREWRRRQVLATEQLVAEMAESNRLKRLELETSRQGDAFGGRLEQTQNPATGDEIYEMFRAMPKIDRRKWES
jgi:hypothetical protein